MQFGIKSCHILLLNLLGLNLTVHERYTVIGGEGEGTVAMDTLVYRHVLLS